MSVGYEGLLPNTFPTPTNVGSADLGTGDAMRLLKVIIKVNRFYSTGIQEVITKKADEMKTNLEQTAPYDTQEIDDYHMTEHMKDSPIKNGREIESEAAYSGHLEYGTAYHGIQYIFFRPAMEKMWKEYKEEVIKEMKGILRT